MYRVIIAWTTTTTNEATRRDISQLPLYRVNSALLVPPVVSNWDVIQNSKHFREMPRIPDPRIIHLWASHCDDQTDFVFLFQMMKNLGRSASSIATTPRQHHHLLTRTVDPVEPVFLTLLHSFFLYFISLLLLLLSWSFYDYIIDSFFLFRSTIARLAWFSLSFFFIRRLWSVLEGFRMLCPSRVSWEALDFGEGTSRN